MSPNMTLRNLAEESPLTKESKPTLNIDKTSPCHLKWTNITKTVEIKDQSSGLISSSIGGDKINDNKQETSPKVDTKIILNQISGQAKPGEILALMGPSGSGKTSLLDVLASRSAYNAGTIFVNDTSMTDNPDKMKALKRRIAYIKQKDIFFEHLSVKDQLVYTAFLRLGDEYTKEEKMNEVEKIIQLLRLEKCADTPIMLVSGGERKRVNIGTELLTNPSIILLDEPTSGLDSTSAVALMSLLVSLAHDHGKTIITSIHQPSSAVFHKFDNVLFLADGCVVYYGSPSDSLSYCKQLGYACPDGYNSADHWMDLLVEDSAIPTNLPDENILEGDEENNVTSSFPIKMENIDETTAQEDDVTKNSLTTASTPTVTNMKKGRFANISRKFSSMTQTSKKGIHLFDLTKQKRDEYVKIKTPKGRLISTWNVDAFAEEIEVAQSNDMETGSLESSSIHEEMKKEKKFNTSWSTQFFILLHRSLKNSRAAVWTSINFFKSVALGILTGLLWWQVPHDEAHLTDRHSFIFFAITYWVFDGTFTAIFTFPNERDIIFKERASGSYYLSAYFLSKTLSEMPTRLLLPTIFWTLAYWMTGINFSIGVFFGTLGCTLLAVLAGESYGLLCGALVMDFERAMTIMVVISLTSMAAGGFYVQNIPVWLTWVKYTSPFKFGYEASQIMIFDGPVKCDGSGILAEYCTEGVEFATREQVLDFINSEGTVAFNIGILFVLIVVPRYLSFLALKTKRGAERS